MMPGRLTIFFSNPKVTGNKLIEPHYQETVKRIHSTDSKYILAIQDQMRLNFTNHYAKTELGRIGKSQKTDQYGLIQHTVLCVTDKNEPLGLIDVKIFDFDEFDTTLKNNKRCIKDKASCRWLEALNNVRQRIGNSQNRIITVADRESDFYEFMRSLVINNEEFVIRSKFSRYTGSKHRSHGEKSWDIVDRSPIRGTIKTSIQDAKSREFRTITLTIKAAEVMLPPVYKGKEVKEERIGFLPIKINIVKAYNAEHEWFLLTNLPIDSLSQVEEIVRIYKSRWHIEDYFKVLKTGYQVDEIYLHSSKQAIENLLIMASVSACRLYWIVYVGRNKDCMMANQLFESFEWKALYVYFGEKIPKECPKLSEILLKIARMGGYKSTSKNAPPGLKTMWHGFQQFIIAAQIYRNLSTTT